MKKSRKHETIQKRKNIKTTEQRKAIITSYLYQLLTNIFENLDDLDSFLGKQK